MKRVLLTLAVIGCGDTTVNPPSQLNLDRPMDIAFSCFGQMRLTDGRTTGSVDDPIILSAQPQSSCEIRSELRTIDDPTPVPPGQEDLTDQGGAPIGGTSWFGFILQSGPGTVALAQFLTKPSVTFTGGDVAVLDADPLTPGKNGISIGEDPIAIATDPTGCKVVTANAGSCDLSVLDVATAVDFNPQTKIDVQRLEVKNAAGVPIRAKPAAMVAEPSSDVVGKACTGTATGVMYIAYPNCHLVAAVDVSNGQIVAGIQYDISGVPSIVDGNVTCPDECIGGATIPAGTRPITIDLEKDARIIAPALTAERRLVIGSDNSPSITVVELDDTTTLPVSLTQFALEVTDPAVGLGVTQLALSPTIGMGGTIGILNDDTAPGGDMQFVYAVATDHSIRVLEVLAVNRECDTQIDPRYLRDIRSVRELSCLQIGDSDTPGLIRRPGARGPGIVLQTDGVPLSVDFVKSVEIEGVNTIDQPERMVGYFAIAGASNGQTFVINVDDDARRDLFESDDPLTIQMPLAISHQLRDAIQSRDLLAVSVDGASAGMPICDAAGPADNGTGTILGGPRTTTNPARTVPAGVFAAEKVTQLPGIRQVKCEGVDLSGAPVVRGVSELSFAAPEVIRDLVYPDLTALRLEESWTLTWEGSLSLDRIDTAADGPQVRESEILVDATSGMRIFDQTRPFCDAGVEPFDIVQLRGCDPAFGNADCPNGYRCFVHPNSQVSGIGACMLDDEADRLADACRDFLTSVRRYTVATTKSGTLGLLPRRHILRTTPVEGCVSNEQCDALAEYAAKNGSSQHPVDDTATDELTWSCEADPLRRPVTTGKRCNLKCDATEDCFLGTICQGGTPGSGTKAGFCMEGVVPPQACVNAPQRYDLRAGEAFAVVGERTGFEHATIANNGTCERDPLASPLLTSRVRLDAPACQPPADPLDPEYVLTGRRPDGTFEPNPCSTTVEQTELVPLYNAGTCTLGPTPTELRTRSAPAIRYRNRGMTMTVVDPVYPGDQMCILDRAGAPGAGTANIPHVFSGYQIGFRQTGGYAPLFLRITATFPVRIVKGPTNSIWVMDEGDFLSTSIAVASTRGKVFRIEPHTLTIINTLE